MSILSLTGVAIFSEELEDSSLVARSSYSYDRDLAKDFFLAINVPAR